MSAAAVRPQTFSTRRRTPRQNPAPAITEQQIITRAQEGDESAFEMLYRQHRRRIFSICLRMVRNVADAEDLAQEAFLQAFRKLHTFRGDAAFSTWLHRLTVNVVLMRFRKRHISELPLEETPGPEDSRDEQAAIRTDDMLLIRSVDRITLERVIQELPPGYQLIFVLHDVLGYEHSEIAEILNCSVGNSKSQLHKARLKLREMLTRGKTRVARRRIQETADSLPGTETERTAVCSAQQDMETLCDTLP